MKAIVCSHSCPSTDPQCLADTALPTPEPEPDDVRVLVRAIAVNPIDLIIRHQPVAAGAAARVLGWDAAGVVDTVGSAVTAFKPGDEVYFAGDITRAGTNSEFCVVDSRIVGRKPKRLSFAEAAALPLTGLTAYEALFDRMHLPRRGDAGEPVLLIVGGAGGVGSLAIQLAKKLTNATVVATASRPESSAWVKELGADHVVDHRKPLTPQLKALNIPEAHYIFCTSSTDVYFPLLMDVVAPQGTLCFIANPGVPVDMVAAQQKSLTIAWELIYTRSLFRTADMIRQQHILDEIATLADSGLLRSTMKQCFRPINAENLRQAHSLIESGATIGKIVLENW